MEGNIYFLFHEDNYGFLCIREDGHAVLSIAREDATYLKVNEFNGNFYFTAESGSWKGSFLGYTDFDESKICCTNDWNLARFFHMDTDEHMNYTTIRFGEDKNWVISDFGHDEKLIEIRLDNRPNYRHKTFIKPFESKEFDIVHTEYWRKGKSVEDETLSVSEYVERANVIADKDSLRLDQLYEMAIRVGIDIRGIKFEEKAVGDFNAINPRDYERENMCREYLRVNVDIKPGLTEWYLVQRYRDKETGIIIEQLDMPSYVNSNLYPGISENILVCVDGMNIRRWKDLDIST